MPSPKSAPSSARFALSALLCLCLPGCMTLAEQRWKPRVQSCQQDRVAIPDWPEEPVDGFVAYSLELLGVIRDDRMA